MLMCTVHSVDSLFYINVNTALTGWAAAHVYTYTHTHTTLWSLFALAAGLEGSTFPWLPA